MAEPRPVQLLRRRRLRLRRLTRADLPALFWLKERPDTLLIEQLAERVHLTEMLGVAAQLQVAVEVDHCLAGALLGCWSDETPDLTRHPWERLDDAGGAVSADGDRSVLGGCGAIWRGDVSPGEIDRALTLGRKAVVQRLGLAGTLSVVRVADWAEWRDRISPQAYLQQVHAGSLADRAVSVWLRNGWLMRGHRMTPEGLEVVMWWGNRAR